MSMRASVLKRSIRPRRRSLTRGWDTRIILAASRCLRRREAISFWTWIIRSARTSRCSASSRRNPKSRNTFPVEGVTLSFMVNLSSRQTPRASMRCQGSESLPGYFHVASRRLPGPFLKRVQYINGFCKLGHVQDAMFQRRVDPDFPYPRSDDRHRLPIERGQALLHTPELESCQSPGVVWKSPDVAARRSEPLKQLLRHGTIYEFRYTLSSSRRMKHIPVKRSGCTTWHP